MQTVISTSTISLGKTIANFCCKLLVAGFGGKDSTVFHDMLPGPPVVKDDGSGRKNNNNSNSQGSNNKNQWTPKFEEKILLTKDMKIESRPTSWVDFVMSE